VQSPVVVALAPTPVAVTPEYSVQVQQVQRVTVLGRSVRMGRAVQPGQSGSNWLGVSSIEFLSVYAGFHPLPLFRADDRDRRIGRFRRFWRPYISILIWDRRRGCIYRNRMY
jgi:hypothetical protein